MDKNIEISKEENGESIALELLRELKLQNKRVIVALFIVLSLWASTIGLFVWYINQYEYASYSVDSKDGGNANFIGKDGDIYNGETHRSNKE